MWGGHKNPHPDKCTEEKIIPLGWNIMQDKPKNINTDKGKEFKTLSTSWNITQDIH